MSTFRAALAKWALPLIGLYLVLVGIGTLFSLAVPAVLIGVIALVTGICALLAS